MAPPKPDIQAQREGRASVVLDLIASAKLPPWPQSELDAISEVKGLFMRVFRMDQWDWFTVSSQLGHPGRGLAKMIGEGLEELRSAARDGDDTGLRRAQKGLCESPARKCLRAFLGKLEIPDEPDAGWVYILSTRRERDLLKIGMTTRTVEERVREINGSTGVAVPYGVRRCWRVSGPARAEKLIHDAIKIRKGALRPGILPNRLYGGGAPRDGGAPRVWYRTTHAPLPGRLGFRRNRSEARRF